MLSAEIVKKYYQALLDKNTEYEGIFYVGVKTTGVFCRPTCPARKPKFENCEFFETAEAALLASFRPCKRCQPLSHPNQVSSLVQQLVESVENNPEKRWKNQDFEKLSIDAARARRQFQKRFGMTFVEYARARRSGLAVGKIRTGKSVIDTQISMGYESSSGFRDAFAGVMGAAPTKQGQNNILFAAWLDTKLGPMIAIASETTLYLLEFVDRRGLELEVERLRKKTKSAIVPGHTPTILSIQQELDAYFNGRLREFKTPCCMLGSPFQMQVWDALKKIPCGETCSYSDIAKTIGKPSAFRAVANANGANQLAIIIPCHRVINNNGDLGGYGGGITRKQWLISHEKQGYTVMIAVANNQATKARNFDTLHKRREILVLPNAWDASSAKLFEQAGFQAIGTTSAGIAHSLGYAEPEKISREEKLLSIKWIVESVSVPVSADIEAGYASTAKGIAETIKLVIAAGAISVNIEDTIQCNVSFTKLNSNCAF